MMLPVLLFVLGWILVALNIVLFALKQMDLNEFILLLEINVMFLALSVASYGVFYLLYQVRRQVLGRPIYLIEESSDDR
jgi:uncharacterized membrane protein YbhN (UPF0104 family)